MHQQRPGLGQHAPRDDARQAEAARIEEHRAGHGIEDE